MKKFLILTIAILVVSFTSCKKDDDALSIIGTWKINSALFWEGTSPDRGIGSGDAFENECERKEILIFTDKMLTIYSYKKQNDESCLEDVIEASYSISNSTLSYSSFGEAQSFGFKTWSGSKEIMLIETLPNGKKRAKFYSKQ